MNFPALYVLHFDRPIAHARHYVGATADLLSRLVRHANGDGARITQVAAERGIEWQLAAVYKGDAFAHEHAIKRQHNSPRYCPICTPSNLAFIDADAYYPTKYLDGFPTTSTQLKGFK